VSVMRWFTQEWQDHIKRRAAEIAGSETLHGDMMRFNPLYRSIVSGDWDYCEGENYTFIGGDTPRVTGRDGKSPTWCYWLVPKAG
jgi:homoserine acetyltransferase